MAKSGKQHPDLLCCNFNQDFSCVAVGHKKGYTILNCDPYGKVHQKSQGPTAIVEMLFCTSLVALVGAADASGSTPPSPRKLQIVNTKRQSTICELTFPTSILAVKMNRKRLVVVLEAEIYIYDISTMKLLHTIETGPNPGAIIALSPDSERSYLAYPAAPTTTTIPLSSSTVPRPPAPSMGDVYIFDTISLSAVNVIQAHKAPIAALSLSSTGNMLATASEKGTVVRVFSIPDAQKLWQFRRGSSNAKIFSINYNLMSTLLAVSSDSSTIHIYRLNPKAIGSDAESSRGDVHSPTPSETPSTTSPPVQPNTGSGATSSLRRRSYHIGKNFISGAAGYMPRSVSEMWEPQRDFAYIKMHSGGGRSVVAMSGTVPQVMVISSEGFFQAYNIDLENGGECSLMKEFPLLGVEETGADPFT
ncbi:hypothetical protein TREMEDRAFT_71180 [Tremella mesenterica DSM 1558]|uniref:uncharacterized protein n=1 Tax=Tremella mesenterica (strain ATCC 24925 / CBS 8224 / DSM 1558 / NBRC 9311 / NRRL Y-6157 / RJB 2259-6 / UBC 559-6) TaxID=578456 RepID=UPI0003F49BA7|nr:uncharacterized protein TREMEDRAFT_71180 [Tremella mesenterica DSM 1558]EIW71497.1 hypothetical protein TREMEDRAFT_71180 [Tremella mesenterica DSM 1558]